MNQNQINAILKNFKDWDITGAKVDLWVFRKYKTSGQVRYTSKWVDIDAGLQTTLMNIFLSEKLFYSEATPYDLLASNLEGQFLHHEVNQTHADLLTKLTDRPKEENQIERIEELENIDGYLVRIEKQGIIAYAIKKTEQSWQTKKAKNFVNIVFAGSQLKETEDKSFKIAKNFDFIMYKGSIFIENKKTFESLLDYTDDFIASFTSLLQDKSFSQHFQNTTALEDFVGKNSIHLRRMHAVKQKGLYTQASFIARFKTINQKENWGITFDQSGKIVPTPDTASDIITILLDHRLRSLLTDQTFDVPTSSPII